MNPSPLRYPGGKHKLYNYVSRLIKENGFDIKTNAFELQKIYELGGR